MNTNFFSDLNETIIFIKTEQSDVFFEQLPDELSNNGDVWFVLLSSIVIEIHTYIHTLDPAIAAEQVLIYIGMSNLISTWS